MCVVVSEAGKGSWITWDWSFSWLRASMLMQELSLGPLEKQLVLLDIEPSLSSPQTSVLFLISFPRTGIASRCHQPRASSCWANTLPTEPVFNPHFLFLRQGLSLGLEFSHIKLGQRAPEIHLALLPQHWGYKVLSTGWTFYVRSWYQM